MLIEATLLLVGGFAFGAMFNRSGLWTYTQRVYAESKGTFSILRDGGAGDEAKERAARDGAVRFAKFGIVSLFGMAAIFIISAVPMAAAVWLGLTTSQELWHASIHPVVLIVGVMVFVLGAKL